MGNVEIEFPSRRLKSCVCPIFQTSRSPKRIRLVHASAFGSRATGAVHADGLKPVVGDCLGEDARAAPQGFVGRGQFGFREEFSRSGFSKCSRKPPMPRKARQVISRLKNKGFVEDREGHHVFLIYESVAGNKTSHPRQPSVRRR
jgi:hypothetical protein